LTLTELIVQLSQQQPAPGVLGFLLGYLAIFLLGALPVTLLQMVIASL